MEPKFNINRPKISDEEIKKHQDFDKLVKQFKEQSLKKAQGDESWWKNKKIQYATVIAGISVVCTITYLSVINNQKKQNQSNETLITHKHNIQPAKQHTSAFIKEPSQKLKINYSSYKIDSRKKNTITHPGGTKINVPENAFVDKNGHDIQGEVTINYREFHGLADIIASGIPMNYDSAGTKYHFESAGMFDINGSQNGEAVFIKPEKKLEVTLASANSENKFNQYYLDTIEKNWKFLKHDAATAIVKTNTNNATGAVTENKKSEALKKQIEVILPKRIDSVKTIYVKKINTLPVAVQPQKPVKYNSQRPTFVIEGSHDEFPELAAFDNVIFEVGAENKNYRKEFSEITWSDIKVAEGPQKGKNYLLTLRYRERKEELIVYPVLSGADLAKAEKQYEDKLVQYQARKDKREADEKRLLAEMEAKQAALIEQQSKAEADYRREQELIAARYQQSQQQELANNFKNLSSQVKANRIFQVSQFGIYNSDCPHRMPGGQKVNPVFVLNTEAMPIYPQAVYFVNYTNKTVMMLTVENGFTFNYDANEDYALCVFDRTKMYLCKGSDFKNSTEAHTNKFVVKPLPESADNLIDFKKELEI